MMHGMLMQVGGAVPTSAIDMVRQASLITRIVLVFLLLLSLVSIMGMPYTVLEAMMCGCRPISFGWGQGHIRANNRAHPA